VITAEKTSVRTADTKHRKILKFRLGSQSPPVFKTQGQSHILISNNNNLVRINCH